MGIFFRKPVLASSEPARFQERANWGAGWWQHGGLLTITDQRMILVPNRIDFGGTTVEVARLDITRVRLLEAGFPATRRRGPAAFRGQQLQVDIKSADLGRCLVVKVAHPLVLLEALSVT